MLEFGQWWNASTSSPRQTHAKCAHVVSLMKSNGMIDLFHTAVLIVEHIVDEETVGGRADSTSSSASWNVDTHCSVAFTPFGLLYAT